MRWLNAASMDGECIVEKQRSARAGETPQHKPRRSGGDMPVPEFEHATEMLGVSLG